MRYSSETLTYCTKTKTAKPKEQLHVTIDTLVGDDMKAYCEQFEPESGIKSNEQIVTRAAIDLHVAERYKRKV